MATQFSSVWLVIAGTTLGMLIADVPAVFLGQRFTRRIPMRLVHGIAAALFALLGIATLAGFGARLGL
jgi:putative Ca2+/H+ antiporter (TMEM165/GDT1 family)